MAQTPRCEIHPELNADYIIGMVETGEQLFLCAADGARFGLELALKTLPPEEIIGAVAALAGVNESNGDGGPADAPARKRRSKKTPAQVEEPEPESRLPEEPAGAND